MLFKTDEELELVKEAVHRMVYRALDLDGTCAHILLVFSQSFSHMLCYLGTGEHGIGVGKKEYLVPELGPGTVKLMKAIKRTIDPLNLFNPNKVRLTGVISGSVFSIFSGVP